jgi:hypothetical protein
VKGQQPSAQIVYKSIAIAVADNLLTVRPKTVQDAENFAKIEISKVSNWAKDNKRTFNE